MHHRSGFVALVLLLTALASCGGNDGAGSNRSDIVNETDPSRPTEPAASNIVDAPAEEPEVPVPGSLVTSIPDAFVGTYDENVEACGRPSQYRLQLSAKALRFHESLGTVAEVRVDSPTSVSVTADYEGEGQKWRSVLQLDLTDDRATLVVSGDGTSFTRVRCPAAAPGAVAPRSERSGDTG